jgi:predicted PhzF superfamily epimerase YddE/YHI9
VEPVAVYDVGKSWLVEIAEPGTLRNLKPDPSALGHVSRGRVIVTSRSDVAGYDFISRFFAPGVGVDEDPVTGSAHCALAPFWAARLGRRDLVGFQASARGGVVGVQVVGDRVRLSGKAVTVVRGELLEQP